VIDPAVGIVLRKKVGDAVREGEILADVHSADAERAEAAAARVGAAYSIVRSRAPRRPLIHEVVG